MSRCYFSCQVISNHSNFNINIINYNINWQLIKRKTKTMRITKISLDNINSTASFYIKSVNHQQGRARVKQEQTLTQDNGKHFTLIAVKQGLIIHSITDSKNVSVSCISV